MSQSERREPTTVWGRHATEITLVTLFTALLLFGVIADRLSLGEGLIYLAAVVTINAVSWVVKERELARRQREGRH